MQTLSLFPALLARLWAPAEPAPIARGVPLYELYLEADRSPSAWLRRSGELPQCLELGGDAASAASLKVLQPLFITCTQGTAWLSCERDPQDYVLEAGMAHRATPGQSLVLLGMPRATVVLASLEGGLQ